MARRLLTPEGSPDTPQLRPQASPLDTFIRPVQGGGLSQLAAALGSVAPQLRQLGNEVSSRDAEQEAQQGEAWAAEQANSKDVWAGAIRDGKIAPAHSPWFRIAAKKKLGQVAADRFNTALQQKIAELGDAPTPDAFEKAVGEARASFLKDTAGSSSNDLAFMGGFNSAAEPRIAQARAVFAADNAKQFELHANAAYFQSAHASAREAIESGKSVDDIAGMLNGGSAEWASVNPSLATAKAKVTGQSLSKLNSDVVFSLLRSTHNVELAKKLASKIKDGDGVLLDSQEFQARLESESDHATNDILQKESVERTRVQQAQVDATQTARETIMQRWQKGGAVDLSDVEDNLKKAGVLDPHATAVQLLDKVPDEDPRYFVGFRSSIARGKLPAIADLDAAANTHRISASQYNSLVSDITEAQRAERALSVAGMATTDALWSHPAVKAIEESIRAAAKTKAKLGPLGTIISYNGFTDSDVQEAVNQGRMFMASWLSQNWSKYGSSQQAMEQAGAAWRGFALEHGIINTDEAGLTSKVLSNDPIVSSQVKANAAKQVGSPRTETPPSSAGKQAPTYSQQDIHTMRQQFAGFSRMSPDDRRAFLSTPRNRAILSSLGDPPLDSIGQALAKAEGDVAPAPAKKLAPIAMSPVTVTAEKPTPAAPVAPAAEKVAPPAPAKVAEPVKPVASAPVIEKPAAKPVPAPVNPLPEKPVPGTIRMHNGHAVYDSMNVDPDGHMPTHRVDAVSGKRDGESWESYEKRVLATPASEYHPHDIEQHTSVDALEPEAKTKVTGLIAEAEAAGVKLKVAETYRSQKRQEYLFRQGRAADKKGGRVTWTLTSDHTTRRAADLKPARGTDAKKAYAWIQANAPKHGFAVMGDMDPGHVSLPTASKPR